MLALSPLNLQAPIPTTKKKEDKYIESHLVNGVL